MSCLEAFQSEVFLTWSLTSLRCVGGFTPPLPPPPPSGLPGIADGTVVLDRYGDIWRYNLATNAWIYVSYSTAALTVTETQDGLIPQNVFTRIEAIRNSFQNGLKFDFLKIYPHIYGYYYLFRSANHTIQFEPESAQDLRIEVNRPRLLALLSQLRCPGAKGLSGLKGEPGTDGRPGEPEAIHQATINDSQLLIDVVVDNSLGTPLLLRMFANNSSVPTITIKIVNSEFEVIQSKILIDQESTFFDYFDGHLTGRITSLQWGHANWQYKVAQMGRKGPGGNDGNNFIEILVDSINDNTLHSKQAVILLRPGDEHGALYYFASELFDANCVSKLAISHTCSAVATMQADAYAAVRMNVGDCKNITKYQFKSVDVETPTLLFSEWTPVESCLRQRHMAASRLQWPDFTDVGAKILPWCQANQNVAGDPHYPWGIYEPSSPGQRCCQEDFFFCSNVNEGGCPVLVVEPLAAPPIPARGCECDCPISFLLSGGYEFEDINITRDGVNEDSAQSVVCTLDGNVHNVHEYRINVNVSSDSTDVVTINWTLSYNDACDEARNLYASQGDTIPGFILDPREAVLQADCPISWAIRDQSPTDMQRQGDNYLTSSSVGTMSFSYRNSPGIISVAAEINLLRQSCCLGYSLSVSVTNSPSSSS